MIVESQSRLTRGREKKERREKIDIFKTQSLKYDNKSAINFEVILKSTNENFCRKIDIFQIELLVIFSIIEKFTACEGQRIRVSTFAMFSRHQCEKDALE